MATDDSGQNNQNGEPTPEPEKAEDRANRMNAAKAFYRAMYAGEDVAPDDFGIDGSGGTGGGGGGGGRPSGPCPNCARLEAQAAEFEKQKNEAENFYKRIAADFENYRRRLDRERDEFQGLGIQKAVEQILPALDDMDRAKTSLQNVSDPKAILDSLNLVFTRFAKCLEATGVKQMEVIGEPFDPRLHEPVQEVETQEYADGAVVHELRRGYTYKDKVLRPALVNVASNPSGVIVPKAKAEEAPPAATPVAATAAVAETAPAPAEAAPAATAEPSAAVSAPATATPEASAATEAKPAPSTDATSTPASQPAPSVAPAESTAPTVETDSSTKAQPDAQNESAAEAPKKAIDKLKPTRPHSETQDLPVYTADAYESLAPLPEETSIPSPPKGEEGGTVYDITDVDVEEKPTELDETPSS